MIISKVARRKREEYEKELFFEGTKAFIRAAYNTARNKVEMLDVSEEDKDELMLLIMGSCAMDMWKDGVSENVDYDTYRKRATESAEKQFREMLENERKREDKAAEESGYRII